jgi:hypothetical protein
MKSRLLLTIPALIILIAASSHAGSRFDDQDRTVARLTSGIQTLKIEGAPGLLTVFGEQAFTILTDTRGRSLVAGATHGNGRIAAITHGSWFQQKVAADPENGRFIANLLSWTAGDKTQIHVLGLGLNPGSSLPGIQILQMERANRLPEDLSRYDLILIDFTGKEPQGFDAASMASLKQYVTGGGGILCSALGWVYNSYGDGRNGKSLDRDFAGNRFLKEYGMIFNGDFTGNRIPLAQSSGNKNHPLLLADRVGRIVETRARVPENELNGLLTAMLAYRNRIPHDEALLRKFETHYDSFGKRRDISSKNPVRKTDAGFLLTIGMLNLLYQSAPYERVSKLKDAEIFPGDVGPAAVETIRTVNVDLSKLRWQSTGLYAPAGRPVSFTIDPGDAKAVMFRIGAHSDVLFPLDDRYRKQLNRWPDLSRTTVLDGAETIVTSPHGGLIYFEKIGKPENRTARIKVHGAVEAPYFRLGKTDTRKWNSKIRHYDAPWGELAGDRIILTLPAATIRKIDNPEKILRYWDRVLSFYPQLQQEPPKNYEERFVTDVQPKIGYMHAGYPIVIRMDVSDFTAGVALNPADRTDLYKAGSWGHFHELGHNCQRSEWTFDGTTEVTVNLFTLYAMEKMHGIIPAEHPWHREGWVKLKKYIAKGSPFEEWKKDPQLALTTYILLQKEFGWEAFKRVFASYQKLSAGEKPKTDQEKRDLWVILFSRVIERDLGPYYTKIGMPVSASVLNEVKRYPRWMPASL